jgi:ABC-type phosphate transport system permease subunit
VALAAATGALIGAAPSPAVAAGAATMRIDVSAPTVNGGETFTVNIVGNADAVSIGAEATLAFDPILVQVTSITPGPAYARGLSLFGVKDDGTPATVSAAETKANQTGTVVIAASGIAPAGDAVIVTLTMQAVKGPGGKASLALRTPAFTDADGNTLPATSTVANVTVAPTSGVTAPPAPSGGPSGPSGPASVTLIAAPESVQVAVGGSVKVDLEISTTADVGKVVADLHFDSTVVQVQTVELGPLWSGARLQFGLGTPLDQAIAQANSGGTLTGVTVPAPASAAGQGANGTFAIITLKAVADGTSVMGIAGYVYDPDGAAMPVSIQASSLVVGSGATAAPGGASVVGGGGNGSGGPSPLLILAVVLAIVGLGGGAILLLPRPGFLRRRWPYVVSLALGLIPVLVFVGVVAIIVINSLPAFGDPGLPALLGDQFVGKYSGGGFAGNVYGLLPALVGTVLIAAIAVVLALPVSLAMAIISTEFAMGPVGRVMRPLIGLLSGIPPIVYAASVMVFVRDFMIPKFAANTTFDKFNPATIGANPATWPPVDVPFNSGSFPWSTTIAGGNSTLLGGILIALLLIPFMTPMIADAIRNVPTSAREASVALGANRVYTLRKAILPVAMPGIVTALALGTLKAVGDIVIISFAVGWQAQTVPNPIADVLERTPALAAEAANMIVPFNNPEAAVLPTDNAVGNLSALMLLLAAAMMVLLMNYLKARWRRRMSS